MQHVDLAVLGGGTAGLTAATWAAAAGKEVVVIEAGRLGDGRAWSGSVPARALLKAARVSREVQAAPHFGIHVEGAWAHFGAVMAYVRRTVSEINRYDDVERLRAKGIAVRIGRGRLLDSQTVTVEGERYRARNVIICTGSRPAEPDLNGLKRVPHLTTDNLFSLDALPQHLLILGAGSNALEIAVAFRALGGEVTVVDAGPDVLPREDPDVARFVRAALERDGIRFVLGAQAERVEWRNEVVRLSVELGDKYGTLDADALLVATGRHPNVDDLGLEESGVQVDRQGIAADERLRTSAASVYAAGDVTGLFPYTHFATYQARVAVQSMLGNKAARADYRAVPVVLWTEPEVARVGLTEPEARAQQPDAGAVVLPYTAIDRAVIDREVDGFVKLVVGKKPVRGFGQAETELLGAHVVGAGASELVAALALAVAERVPVSRLSQVVPAYPTMAVGVQQALALLTSIGQAVTERRDDLGQELTRAATR